MPILLRFGITIFHYGEDQTDVTHSFTRQSFLDHTCGYFDYREPRRTTCCMNYGPNWMINANLELIPGTSRRIGNDMCGRHLKEVRRVHLEENKGLRWK